MFINIILHLTSSLLFAATEFETRAFLDNNVYQSQALEESDMYIRFTGRFSDFKQSGNIYFEKFVQENNLDSLGGSYSRKLATPFNKWEPFGKVLLQYYLDNDSRLANENINLISAGADIRRKFFWGKSTLLIIPDFMLYRFSGASRRTDVRPSGAVEYYFQLNTQLQLSTGLVFYFNVSSDSQYSFNKSLLFGEANFKITNSSLAFARLVMSSTNYPNRYGTTAPIYSNRGRLIGVANRQESVSSNSVSLGYEKQLDPNKGIGTQILIYNQRSVSTLLNYASSSIGAWFSYYF
ncbi:MAG: hypothetical protein SGJ18_03960 [Pseudomonadota bacterium]|nr:hypothetical protein [Pseudomonadota bacterium]